MFKAEMVRAILAGRKTQTRRLVKLPHMNPLGVWEASTVGGPGSYLDKAHTIPAPEMPCVWHTRTGDCIGCAYHVGDRLWVRETATAIELSDGRDGVRYTADQAFRPIENTQEAAMLWLTMHNYRGTHAANVPPIHMPRWASRITLEITDVRPQRLHDITEGDISAEGVQLPVDEITGNVLLDLSRGGPCAYLQKGEHFDTLKLYRAHFAALWDSINSKRAPWADNPWVWAISFKVVTP
jgi:hypothetical protein